MKVMTTPNAVLVQACFLAVYRSK